MKDIGGVREVQKTDASSRTVANLFSLRLKILLLLHALCIKQSTARTGICHFQTKEL